MSKKACPLCGSEYFLTNKAEPRTVFQVNGDNTCEIVQQNAGKEINRKAICCGACSWKGSIEELVESR